jgi:GDP-L-fucose synthase
LIEYCGFNKYYPRIKILLTGGSGMFGRNLQDTAPATLWASSSKELNLLSFSNVLNAMTDYKPDLIIHAVGRVGGIAANMGTPLIFCLKN